MAIKIHGFVDSRSVVEREANPQQPVPLVFIIGSETADFGDLEQLTMTPGAARKVAKAILRAVCSLESGQTYESKV